MLQQRQETRSSAVASRRERANVSQDAWRCSQSSSEEPDSTCAGAQFGRDWPRVPQPRLVRRDEVRRQCNSCNSSPPTVKPVERSRVIPSDPFRTLPSETVSAPPLSLARLRSCLLGPLACAPASQAVAPPLRLQQRSRWAAAARAARVTARVARARARAARSGQPNSG